MLARNETSLKDAGLLAEMLSLPNDGRYPVLDLTAQQRRKRTLDALTAQLMSMIRRHPVMMILEDVHWIDPSTLEMLGRTVKRVESLRVLFVVTFRPEFEPTWIGQSHVTTLTINRLTRHEIGVMIDNLSGERVIPANIRQDIIERSDGVPLFVEEVTKAVLEAKHQSVPDRTTTVSPPSFEVPATLHASLMARLDRLGAAKEVAQIGATIAREFSHALLAAVVQRPELELQFALDRLVAASLLFREGVPPHATYLFKHALVQDAAYGTLLREPKRELHARIAEVLESRFRDIAESQPELLARHCTEAGLIEKATALWGKAGHRSLARSALVEAAEQLTRALSQIATLPTTPALRREQIKLQVALITPLLHIKGYAAPETKAAAERARLLIEDAEAMGESPEDSLLLFSVLYSFWVANLVAFQGDALCALAGQFLLLAEKQGATMPLMVGHRLMGASKLFTGDVALCRTHFDQAIALYDPTEHRPLATRFGQDVRVAGLGYRSLALWYLGYPEVALADAEQALADAREIGHAATLMYTLAFPSLIHIHRGNYAAAGERLDEVIALADEQDALYWKASGMLMRGCLFALIGKASDAIQMIAFGLTAYRSTGSTMWMPLFLSHLGRAYADSGKFDDARRCIGEAITTVAATGEKWCEAEVHRMAGEISLTSPESDAAKAEACFERALMVARSQQAKSLELRTAMSMARLWRDQGKPQQACELLTPVYGWFTEGFDTLDLKEARALLDELHA
jgi:predicted ATPase